MLCQILTLKESTDKSRHKNQQNHDPKINQIMIQTSTKLRSKKQPNHDPKINQITIQKSTKSQ